MAPGLDGRVVAVTGASRGIGEAVARAAAARGARLGLMARGREALERVTSSLTDSGAVAVCAAADVSSAADVQRAFASFVEALGPVDVLVNNAGVVHREHAATMSETDWDRVLDTNLKGAFLCSRAVLPSMLERGGGRIVNVASISGTLGTPQLTAYCASKWGLIGLTRALAEEVRDAGVSVTAVAPGSVDTAMLREGVPGLTPDMTPEEVAELVIFLAAEAPAAMTGSTVEMFG